MGPQEQIQKKEKCLHYCTTTTTTTRVVEQVESSQTMRTYLESRHANFDTISLPCEMMHCAFYWRVVSASWGLLMMNSAFFVKTKQGQSYCTFNSTPGIPLSLSIQSH